MPADADAPLERTIDIAGLEPGQYSVEARVRNVEGSTLVAAKSSFEKPAAPEWLGTDAGRFDGAMPPWTPLDTTATSITAWGRIHEFAHSPWPSRIRTRGEEMLAGPVDIVAVCGARPVRWATRRFRITRRTDARVEWEGACAAPELAVDVSGYMEVDGMALMDIRIIPRAAAMPSETHLCLCGAESSPRLSPPWSGAWCMSRRSCDVSGPREPPTRPQAARRAVRPAGRCRHIRRAAHRCARTHRP